MVVSHVSIGDDPMLSVLVVCLSALGFGLVLRLLRAPWLVVVCGAFLAGIVSGCYYVGGQFTGLAMTGTSGLIMPLTLFLWNYFGGHREIKL